MKPIFLTILSLLTSWLAPKPTANVPATLRNIPMCGVAEMQKMAADPAFQALHQNPLPFSYQPKAGEMIAFSAADGKPANAFFLKSKKPSDKWLLVYQEWWGLNDNIKQQAESFYNDLKNVNVLAVDMYDGKVATERAEAAKLMQGADKARLGAIMKGAIAYAGPKADIASVGWCFGGSLSLQSAMLAGKQAKGCIIYYGFPEQDVAKLKTLDTDVLGIFGNKDKAIGPQVVDTFEANMKTAGEKIEVVRYEADHGFANPSNPSHDKNAATDAYKRSLTYLRDRLKA
jgi:carboxymethylenebutenolidase